MATSTLRLLEASESLFFGYQDGALRQWIEVTLQSRRGEAIDARVTIRAGGETAVTQLTIAPGTAAYRCYAPLLWPARPAEDHADLRVDIDGEATQATCPVGHHRPWVIYVLADVCTDATWVYGSYEAVRKDDADLTAAELALAEATRAAPEANRNRYNLVHALELEYFEEFYPERVAQLAEAMRRDEITLNPFYNMTLSANISLEEQIRLFYKARQWAVQYGIAMRYANHQETPSIAWDMAGILAGCGVDYLIKGILPYECPWAARLEEPPVFLWEGPDGSRVKLRRRNSDYTEGRFVLEGLEATNRGLHEQVIPEFEGWGERYPFSVIGLVGCYGDLIPAAPGKLQSRDLPALKAASVARYNDQGWAYPRLVNGSHAQFWSHLDREIAERDIQLEVYRGDYGVGWDIWPACLASDVAGWRRAGERSALADRLAAVLAQLDPAWWQENRSTLAAGWKNLLMLADHAWNGANDANRLLNAQLRREWQLAANAHFDRVVAGGLVALARQVSGAAADSLLVFNGLGWRRDGLVRLKDARAGVQVRDLHSGEVLPAQRDPQSGELVFLARDLPSLGYRTYRLQDAAAAPSELPWRVWQNGLEGPFYLLEIDEESGAIRRLYDKLRGRELVDPDSPYRLNQCLYFSDGSVDDGRPYPLLHPPKAGEGVEDSPRLALVEAGAQGPLSASLIVTAHMPGIRLRSTITLYADLERVDICNELTKAVSDERQQVDFAFPFHVPGREFRAEQPGAVVDPEKEMRPGAGLSAAVVRHFVDVFNRDYGVTLALVDSFAVQFGGRTTTLDPQTVDPSATLLALALGNIYDANEAIRDQAGVENFTFRFSLRGHAGGFDAGAAVRFGWEASQPAEAVALTDGQAGGLPAGEHSFARLEPESMILAGFKAAEEGGLIARVWDCAGDGTAARLRLSIPSAPAAATLSDHLERDRQALELTDGTASVPVRPRGVSTVRFVW